MLFRCHNCSLAFSTKNCEPKLRKTFEYLIVKEMRCPKCYSKDMYQDPECVKHSTYTGDSWVTSCLGCTYSFMCLTGSDDLPLNEPTAKEKDAEQSYRLEQRLKAQVRLRMAELRKFLIGSNLYITRHGRNNVEYLVIYVKYRSTVWKLNASEVFALSRYSFSVTKNLHHMTQTIKPQLSKAVAEYLALFIRLLGMNVKTRKKSDS